MPVTSTVSSKGDFATAIKNATRELLQNQVLVGIPGSSERAPEAGEKQAPSNALIGYVQEFGSEDKGIPARPFLYPGVEAKREQIAVGMGKAGKAGLDGNLAGVQAGLSAVGLIAQASVKDKLLNGAFAPLADATLKARARRGGRGETTMAAKRELASRAAGNAPSVDARPLYDTHSLFNAITYVVDRKGS